MKKLKLEIHIEDTCSSAFEEDRELEICRIIEKYSANAVKEIKNYNQWKNGNVNLIQKLLDVNGNKVGDMKVLMEDE